MCLLDGHLHGVKRCCCHGCSLLTLLLGLFCKEVRQASFPLVPLETCIPTRRNLRFISIREWFCLLPLAQHFATHCQVHGGSLPVPHPPPLPQDPEHNITSLHHGGAYELPRNHFIMVHYEVTCFNHNLVGATTNVFYLFHYGTLWMCMSKFNPPICPGAPHRNLGMGTASGGGPLWDSRLLRRPRPRRVGGRHPSCARTNLTQLSNARRPWGTGMLEPLMNYHDWHIHNVP